MCLLNKKLDSIRAKLCFARIFVLLCASLALFSCESNPVTPSSEDIGWIPFKKGNLWKFIRTYYDPLGNVILIQHNADSIFIAADTVLDGKKWYYRRYFGHKLAYRNTSSGVMARLVSENTLATPFVQYKFPVQTGEAFGFPIVFFSGYQAWLDDITYTATVISTDTTITVPAGSFRCVQYRLQRASHIFSWQDEFIAPRFGWVKRDSYYTSNDSVFKVNSLELSKLTLIE